MSGILIKSLELITLLGQLDTWMENNIKQNKNCAKIYSQPEEMEAYTYTKVCIQMFITALLTVSPNLKQTILMSYCITHYLNIQWLKPTHMYYLTVSVDQEFGSSSAGLFWLWNLDWNGKLCFQHGSLAWLLAVSHCMGFSTGLNATGFPHIMVTDFPHSGWSRREQGPSPKSCMPPFLLYPLGKSRYV